VLDVGSPVTPPVGEPGPDPDRHDEPLQGTAGGVIDPAAPAPLARNEIAKGHLLLIALLVPMASENRDRGTAIGRERAAATGPR
jgi:hypothetical protein